MFLKNKNSNISEEILSLNKSHNVNYPVTKEIKLKHMNNGQIKTTLQATKMVMPQKKGKAIPVKDNGGL
jgi:hypothetical protein